MAGCGVIVSRLCPLSLLAGPGESGRYWCRRSSGTPPVARPRTLRPCRAARFPGFVRGRREATHSRRTAPRVHTRENDTRRPGLTLPRACGKIPQARHPHARPAHLFGRPRTSRNPHPRPAHPLGTLSHRDALTPGPSPASWARGASSGCPCRRVVVRWGSRGLAPRCGWAGFVLLDAARRPARSFVSARPPHSQRRRRRARRAPLAPPRGERGQGEGSRPPLTKSAPPCSHLCRRGPQPRRLRWGGATSVRQSRRVPSGKRSDASRV